MLLKLFRDASLKRLQVAKISNAYRLFNGVGDGLEGVTLDRFGEKYQLQFFKSYDKKNYELICNAVKELYNPHFLVAKWRTNKSGKSLEHPQIDIVLGKASDAVGVVCEGNAQFNIDLLDTVNPGLFLDMRDIRLDVQERIKQMKDREVRFLNLFSYTCSFSVHARLGGAALATNADISGKILDKGRANYALNNLDIRQSEFFRGNATEYVTWAIKKGLRFDGIVLDPPSFARFKGMNFNVRHHLIPLVKECAKLLNAGGFFMVSSNYSEFKLEQFSKDVFCAVKEIQPQAKIAWMRDQGEDFCGTGLVKESSLVATMIEV